MNKLAFEVKLEKIIDFLNKKFLHSKTIKEM